MGPVITGGVTILFGWLLIRGFRTGTMELPARGIAFGGRRRDQPVRFWLTAILLTFLTLLFGVSTITQIFLPHGL